MLGNIFSFFLWGLTVKCHGNIHQRKDSEDFTNSIDVSSSDERVDDETVLPAIVVTSDGPVLETMETLDDVDDEETFINELMAIHPNDEDVVVEDLEVEAIPIQTEVDGGMHEVQEAEEAFEIVVRHLKVNGLPLYRSQLWVLTVLLGYSSSSPSF